MTRSTPSAAPEMPPESFQRTVLSVDTIRELLNLDERDQELLEAQIGDVEKKEELARQIAERLADPALRERFPDLPDTPEHTLAFVGRQLDRLQEELRVKEEVLRHKAERLKELENDPVKKSLKEKALDALRKGWNFTWKHKWKILAVLAVIAAGAAAWYYWNTLAGLLGVGTGEGAAEVAAGAGGAETLQTAVEAAAQTIQDNTLSIVTSGRDAVYVGSQQFTVEEFGALVDQLRVANPQLDVTMWMDPSSRASLESAIEGMLHERGVQIFVRGMATAP